MLPSLGARPHFERPQLDNKCVGSMIVRIADFLQQISEATTISIWRDGPKTKISHNLQAGGLLDIVPAPRRRSWRTEELRGGKSKDDEVVESKLKSHLYVNLPERSSSYDYGRGRLQSKGFEGHVPICQETTPL